MSTAALVALLIDVAVEVIRALVKKKLGLKQLPEPKEGKEVISNEA